MNLENPAELAKLLGCSQWEAQKLLWHVKGNLSENQHTHKFTFDVSVFYLCNPSEKVDEWKESLKNIDGRRFLCGGDTTTSTTTD